MSPANTRKMPPVHPGEILLKDLLEPMGISQYRLARDVRVDPRRINAIIHGKRAVTPDTALRLARYFDMSPRFWLNAQMRYDLEVAEDESESRIAREVQPLARQK